METNETPGPATDTSSLIWLKAIEVQVNITSNTKWFIKC